jgi:hypothetical protein
MRRGSLRAYMRAGTRFFPTWDKWQPEMRTVGEGFFCFCKKDNNGILGWELLELV